MMQIGSDTPLRLFFALWPDAEERKALAAWQSPLQERCGGRLMLAETLHATLVFLGEVAASRLEALCLAAQEVQFQEFELELTTAHYWGHNHIVYAAPDVAPPPLAALVLGLEDRLRRHRFPFDLRQYKPHVTLLRGANWSDAPLPAMPTVHWRFDEFALVRSLREGQGASYEVLARFAAAE